MLAHEKLHVYEKALGFVGAVYALSGSWSRKHAVVDELDRASESLILNLVEAARLHTTPAKLKALDYALGSGLECAACFDVARIKELLPEAEFRREKQRLCEVVRMLIGLRKAWQTWEVHEGSPPYQTQRQLAPVRLFFHHEGLEVYRAALDSMTWLTTFLNRKEPSNRLLRQIDASFTSIALNIAEGNGRYSELDHAHFLVLAQSSAAKASAYVDLMVQKHALSKAESAPVKNMLERIISMLVKMRAK